MSSKTLEPPLGLEEEDEVVVVVDDLISATDINGGKALEDRVFF